MNSPEHITVIGAGLMGHGIAQIFAVHGHTVWLVDQDYGALDSAKERIRVNLSQMIDHGVQLGKNIENVLKQINVTSDLSQACEQCDFVFEAVFEDLALKRELFRELDRLCKPEAILCSNTSVMSITEIASKAERRGRIIGAHFWNPPHLIPLVEVIKAEQSTIESVNAAHSLLQRVGKHPVRVLKDVPGFVGNRLQHALWREAFSLIDEGICDASTVDEVIRYGPGLRWPILGPVENADLIGLDLTKAIHDYILPHINADPTPSPTLLKNVEKGQLGFKTRRGFRDWTDDQIAATQQRLSDYLLDALIGKQP